MFYKTRIRTFSLAICCLICATLFSSCASVPMVQPQVNSLVVARKFDHALIILEDHKEGYGPRNRLLYKMDYGLVLHMAGRYRESIRQFEEAKRVYDELYTISLSNEFSTWLVNDIRSEYHGEDFERVMINIFQALNFAALGEFDEALVEARDVDSKLKAFNSRYRQGEKNRYSADGFARLLMGIMYEATGTPAGFNDAYISNIKAVEAYKQAQGIYEDIEIPQLLKENLLATAEWMGQAEFRRARQMVEDVSFTGLARKKDQGEVYLVVYHGFAPIKHETFIPIPLPGGIYTKLAFPTYHKRVYVTPRFIFKAVGGQGKTHTAEAHMGENIEKIAIQTLADRRARVIAKAAARIGGKYFAEKIVSQRIEDRHGEDQARWFRYLSSLYNISTERADLRSWQTLPAAIYLARLVLPPGEYELYLDEGFIRRLEVGPGSREFIILRQPFK